MEGQEAVSSFIAWLLLGLPIFTYSDPLINNKLNMEVDHIEPDLDEELENFICKLLSHN
jgi:hypothetical protein